MAYKRVYLVLHGESEDRVRNSSTGISIYSRKSDAEKMAKKKNYWLSSPPYYVKAFDLVPVEEDSE